MSTEDPSTTDSSFETIYVPGDTNSAKVEDMLLEKKLITHEQLDRARTRFRDGDHSTLLQVILEQTAGMSARIELLKAVAEHMGRPFRRVTTEDISADVFSQLPVRYMHSHRVVPVQWTPEGTVEVATSAPTDQFALDELHYHFSVPFEIVVTTPEDIESILSEMTADFTDDSMAIEEAFNELEFDDDTGGAKGQIDLEDITGDSPVVRYVSLMIASASSMHASDIHIEPCQEELRVRFRVDGILMEQDSPNLSAHPAIISRLKIMANLDISERRLPQDGRIRVRIHNRAIDLRLSLTPSIHGEKCVIRLLDSSAISMGLEKLGFDEELLTKFKEIISEPNGVFLVTGPTGSGKSTTLYSALELMDRMTRNISTVEEPVEYQMDGITQINVNEDIGLTFSTALRSLLRQDPDIIMVGEIRDRETARIAIQASLTGHFVMSTLHTNDAPSSLIRLRNIGIENYLIASALTGVLAQRLVRRICTYCKTEVEPSAAELGHMDRMGYKGDIHLFRGVGCSHCRQLGYRGRLGIFELLHMNDEFREEFAGQVSASRLREVAVRMGMRTLREDGFMKVNQGLTTIEEITRVL